MMGTTNASNTWMANSSPSDPNSDGVRSGALSSILSLVVVSSDDLLEYCSKSTAVHRVVLRLNGVLSLAGVPRRSLITEEELCLCMFAMVCTLVAYFFLFGKRHVRRRKALAEDLRLAQMQVHYLEEKLLLAESEDIPRGGKKDRPIRIFMDGAFDVMHYGHMNAFRLARSLGTHLIVGINSDSSIAECKGPPLMNDAERMTMVSGCKFVDEIVPGCPYVMNSDYLEYVFKKYKVDYVVHGDDPCLVDGKDVYESAKASGRFRSIPRTEGVSTTDILGRMLLMKTDHHCDTGEAGGGKAGTEKRSSLLLGRQSKFLTTSRMLRLFSAGVENPTKDMRVIYTDGAFDMFHPGHVALLKEAKQRGDYLIVGVHGDGAVNRRRGFNMPLMNLHERVLSVLGCRYVDDVVIDAPSLVTTDMISSLNIAEVVHGSRSDNVEIDHLVRYAIPKKMDIYKIVESPTDFSLKDILQRVQRNQQTFQAKFERKMKAENDFYKDKYGLASAVDGGK